MSDAKNDLNKTGGLSFSWTTEQRNVIEAPATKRLLIDAGPGTGKTATACARIAWLINCGGIEASEMWLISFTRTAVHELRTRISSYLKHPGDVAAIKIATLDAHAWAIHSGFSSDASLTGTFEDNIQQVVQLVRDHEGVFSYIASVRHLIVDEAQDIVGPRCELLLEIINALQNESGVSVFSDEAQAIYGFADEDSHGDIGGTLPEMIRKYMPEQFSEQNLSYVHRTTDITLLKIFQGGRSLIRSQEYSGAQRLENVREFVENTNHGTLGSYWEDMKNVAADQTDALLLFRRRGDALSASANLELKPHRLRMSGLPHCIHGWISIMLWDWIEPELAVNDFERLWKARIGPAKDKLAKDAWSVLIKAFGCSTSRISMTQMVKSLAGNSPTYELTLPEFGYSGPILSTIHASKGREAGEVRLYLPEDLSDDATNESIEEEARILFVGATRAKRTLQVGQAKSRTIARRLQSSGRAFTPHPFKNGKKSAKAAVEIGRTRDIDALGLVGRGLYSAVEARNAQTHIVTLRDRVTLAYAEATNPDYEWRFRVRAEKEEQTLCYLSQNLNTDIFEIAKIIDSIVRLNKKKPPKQLFHLRSFGVRTLAISPNDSVREQLHAPWCDSGLIAAPMLIGYSMANFR